MKEKHSFIAELKANIELSEADFKLLLECSSRHYDNTVQSATMVGGFLYGINNRRTWAKDRGELDFNTEFTYRQIDLMLKSLEVQNSNRSIHLSGRLYSIAQEMHKKNSEINDSLK